MPRFIYSYNEVAEILADRHNVPANSVEITNVPPEYQSSTSGYDWSPEKAVATLIRETITFRTTSSDYNKIGCVKAMRTLCPGMDLRTAKDFVETHIEGKI